MAGCLALSVAQANDRDQRADIGFAIAEQLGIVLNHDIPVYRIYVVGMGNAPVPSASTEEQPKTKRTSGGRVEISLMKNDLEQLSANSTAPDQPATAK